MDEIPHLKELLAWWDTLASISTLSVLVGVIVLSITQFEPLTTWSGLARFPRWHRPIEALGAVLLIVGMAGEILSTRNGRNINDRIAAHLAIQAGTAMEHSKALEKEAAQLRLQLAKLKWRVITEEQQATLVGWLRNVPKGPVTILHKLDDEPWSYAIQIRDALKAAGFDPRLEESPIALNLPGTWILVTDLQHPPPHAVPIQAAFREIHVELDGQQDPQRVPDGKTAVIVIGSRRP